MTGQKLTSSVASHGLVRLALAYWKGREVRVIDDITPQQQLKWGISKRAKERDTDSVREIKREPEREGRNPNRQRERERYLGIFIMRFDSATSSFPASLVIKSYKN